MLVDVFGVRACVPSRASVGIEVARDRERPRICLLPFRRVQYDVEHPEVSKRALTAVRIVQYVIEVFRSRSVFGRDRVERPARTGERARERVGVGVVSLDFVLSSSPASIGTRRSAPTGGIRWWTDETVRLSSRVNLNVHALGWSAQRLALERDCGRECECANANLFVAR